MLLTTLREKTLTIPEGNSMFKSKRSKFKYGYVSEIDQFLQELNKLPGIKSNSRLDEEQKYKEVFDLRDIPQAKVVDESTWKEF